MRAPFYQALYLFLLLWTFTACKKEQALPPVTQPANAAITADNYNLLAVGLTYAQVVNILGHETAVSTTTYSWSADDTNTIVITITFSASNTLVAKSQRGLYSASTGTGTGGGTTTASGCPATYNGHAVYTGPRGGCYYLNSKGNKTYI